MAKRVVVFDPVPPKPKKAAPKSETKPKAAPKPATPAPAAAVTPKPEPAPKPKQAPPAPAPDLSSKFADAYRKDAAAAMERARERAADKTRQDRAFQAMKAEFLAKILDGGDGFSKLEEPLFWSEFKRVAELIAKRPQDRPWRKAGAKMARELAGRYSKLRMQRDGYQLITPPLSMKECVFYLAGTTMFLERQIEAEPDRAGLRELLNMHDLIYRKFFHEQGKKLAAKLRTGRKLWKNPETQDYLLRLEPEAEKQGQASA